ncbi:hypothetical protein GCM10027074_30920 [Streptomyces deserti]
MVAWGKCGLNGRSEALVSVIGDPVLRGAPFQGHGPDPGRRGPARTPTCCLPGQWVASRKGARPWAVTQAHPLGSDPALAGEVPEEVDLADLRSVSGHPYKTRGGHSAQRLGACRSARWVGSTYFGMVSGRPHRD